MLIIKRFLLRRRIKITLNILNKLITDAEDNSRSLEYLTENLYTYIVEWRRKRLNRKGGRRLYIEHKINVRTVVRKLEQTLYTLETERVNTSYIREIKGSYLTIALYLILRYNDLYRTQYTIPKRWLS